MEEILEMGIDGFWIGYEGTRSNYAKQQGRPVDEILTEFREHGITVLTSMIVGFDYQTPEVVAQELAGLMKLKPALAQFLIYGLILSESGGVLDQASYAFKMAVSETDWKDRGIVKTRPRRLVCRTLHFVNFPAPIDVIFRGKNNYLPLVEN